MSLAIAYAETDPGEAAHTEGSFETPHGDMAFSKYFYTEYTGSLLVIRTAIAPALDETFLRINRAADLAGEALQDTGVTFGAKLAVPPEEADWNSTDMSFQAEFPLAISDVAGLEELDIQEDGTGLLWFRIGNEQFEVYADNPATREGEHTTLGAFIPVEGLSATEAAGATDRWLYADALLTPSANKLPGALGDTSIRAALLELEPGATSV